MLRHNDEKCFLKAVVVNVVTINVNSTASNVSFEMFIPKMYTWKCYTLKGYL